MYKAVKDVLASNESVWTGIPAFVAVHDSFINKLIRLEQGVYNQNLSTIGVNAAKNAKRQTVIDKAFAISSGIVAYAVLNNDAALIDQIKIAKHTMSNASKANLIIMIDRIIAKASEFGNEIMEFGVSEENVTELQTLRDELEIILNSTRNAIIARKGYTRMIKGLTEDLSVILSLQLDRLMEVLKGEHPEFFAAYKDARVIIDHGTGKRGSDKSESDERRPNGSAGTSNTFGYEE